MVFRGNLQSIATHLLHDILVFSILSLPPHSFARPERPDTASTWYQTARHGTRPLKGREAGMKRRAVSCMSWFNTNPPLYTGRPCLFVAGNCSHPVNQPCPPRVGSCVALQLGGSFTPADTPTTKAAQSFASDAPPTRNPSSIA